MSGSARRCAAAQPARRDAAAPRAVPVLARYHGPLLEAAAFAGEQLLTGGTGPGRPNISNPLTRSLAGGTGLPALDTSARHGPGPDTTTQANTS